MPTEAPPTWDETEPAWEDTLPADDVPKWDDTVDAGEVATPPVVDSPSLRPSFDLPQGVLAPGKAGAVGAMGIASEQAQAPVMAAEAQAKASPNQIAEAFAEPVGGELSPENRTRMAGAIETLITGTQWGAVMNPDFRRGVAEAAVETEEGLRSMQGLLMTAGASVPGAVGIPGKALISAIMAKEAGIAAGEASVSAQQGDLKEAGRQAFHSAIGALGAAGLAGHTGIARAREGSPAALVVGAVERARAAAAERTAAVLDEFIKQVDDTTILGAEARATGEPMPSPPLLETPEALRRTKELQLAERLEPTAPEGMVKTEARFDQLLPRTIMLQLDEAATEAIRLAVQRQAERAKRAEGGKLDTSGETFSGVERTPEFLKSAEQKVTERPSPPEPTAMPPDVSPSTPLKTVQEIVRGQLERRDWVNAVATLGQAKAEVSRKVVDNLLGVGNEGVPLSAGERLIFNEIWERALEKAGVKAAAMDVVHNHWKMEGKRTYSEQWESTVSTIDDVSVEFTRNGEYFRIKSETPSIENGFDRTFDFALDVDKHGNVVFERNVPSHVRDKIIQEAKRIASSKPPINEEVFLRYGDIPKGGKSRNFITGELENGVSVYKAEWNPALERYILADATHSATALDLISQGKTPRFVSGEVIGRGSDGEPLLRSVKIVSEAKVDSRGYAPSNKSIREAIELDPTLTPKQKESILSTGSKGDKMLETAKLENRGFEIANTEAGKSQYTPALKSSRGEIVKASSHEEAFAKGGKGQRGYVDTAGNFLTLLDIARMEMKSNPLVARLESLKATTDPTKVSSTPFPEIAKAIWNTSIDIAIAAVRAGASLKNAIDAALSHLRKNAQGFDEAAVRSYMERVIRLESQAVAGAKAATEVGERLPVKASEPPVISAPSGEPIAPAWRPIGELYSEPIVQRLSRFGGPVARRVTQENLGIISRSKELYGALANQILDVAKRAAGKAFRGGTTWMRAITELTPNSAVSRFHQVLETRARTGNWDHVPERFRPLAEQLFNANLAIGELAERAHPEFTASGRVQRMLTAYGFDIVRRGRGAAWEALRDGLAEANKMSTKATERFLRRWKDELDKPTADAAGLDRIAQDFERHFPNVVTHVRPFKGLGWHEVVHSSPFSYLEQAAQRTAHAVAFREVYPLVQHKGKWVPSGKLEATRKAVQRELRTDSEGAEFKTAFRALQGHPIDTMTAWWNAPDRPIGIAMRGARAAMMPVRTLMLSASSIVNLGETVSGGAQIFLGYGNAFKAILKYGQRAFLDELKAAGMLNAAIRDFSFDPTQPARSASRQLPNIISRTFLTDFMNEFQEFTGAAAARIRANQIRTGTLPAWARSNTLNTMRLMGIDKKRAIEAVEGSNETALRIFETKAAETLSGGNRAIAEMSRLGASRVFNELFWFHSYPMTKMRQFEGLWNNILEDGAARDIPGVLSNAKLLGKFTGGTVLGGALTVGIMRLVYEGLFGTEILRNEAADDFPWFIFESFKMGMGGPVQIAARIFDKGLNAPTIATEILGAMAPFGVATELSNAVTGSGRYEGTGAFERIGLFLKSKTPITRGIKQGMAAFGLSQDNTELDAAINAFYRWRREEFGGKQINDFLEREESRKIFRASMRKAIEALKDGDLDEYDKQIDRAMTEGEASYKQVKESLRRRTILRTPENRKLTPEEMDELRDRIGSEAVDLIEMFDEMLKAQAR